MSRGPRQGGSCRPEEQLCFGTRLKCSKFLLEREAWLQLPRRRAPLRGG